MKLLKQLIHFVCSCALIAAILGLTTSTALAETEAERDARMQWWKEARFGMFIHWGLYAVPAGEYRGVTSKRKIGEWIMDSLNIPIAEYEKFANHFNPVDYDAEEWVRIAKDAGMKYIVITSKHHDGFALWDSKVSKWDIADASPYEKDLLKELADACEKEGIVLCFYHSIMDWHHPDAQAMWEPYYNQNRRITRTNPNFPRYIEKYMKPQLKELLTNYGDIGVLWFDGEWVSDYTTEMGKDVDKYVRSLQPDIIINNRVDKGRLGMAGLDAEGDFAGDFGTPEQEIPDTGIEGTDWESCMTMNDTWGYRKDDKNWKSNEKLIHNLIDIVSKGGNFLLNVGPTAEGKIPQESVTRLKAMGKWLKVNGEAIYAAEASPVEAPAWGRYTTKGNTVYAHVFDWPADGELKVEGIGKVKSASLLRPGSKQKLSVKGDTVVLKGKAPSNIASVVALELR
ncbi:MAG: alpha-L-fucosidase [Puniceicoccaceae bacterium]